MSAEVVTALHRLDAITQELSTRADTLADVERRIEPIELEVQAELDNYELGLYALSLEGGPKLPSESLRLKLARKDLAERNPSLLGEYEGLRSSRERLKTRISSLKAEASAQQSILGALKAGIV